MPIKLRWLEIMDAHEAIVLRLKGVSSGFVDPEAVFQDIERLKEEAGLEVALDSEFSAFMKRRKQRESELGAELSKTIEPLKLTVAEYRERELRKQVSACITRLTGGA